MLEIQLENVVAIHCCSKRSGMTGYRSGFMAGDGDPSRRCKQLRSHPGRRVAGVRRGGRDGGVVRRRARDGAARDLPRRSATGSSRFFAEHGLRADASDATLYLWVRVPAGETSSGYALRLLEQGIVVAPGTAFGAGEGHVRVALVPTLDECEAAVEAWSKVRT